MEKAQKFLQDEIRTQCSCLHALSLLASPPGHINSHITDFSIPAGAASPVLAESHLYYHRSSWQGCKSKPTKSVASHLHVTVHECAFVDEYVSDGDSKKNVFWGRGCLLNQGYIKY